MVVSQNMNKCDNRVSHHEDGDKKMAVNLNNIIFSNKESDDEDSDLA